MNNEVVLNKLLIDVNKIEIDAPECAIFIKEGYTDIGELIVFLFSALLIFKGTGNSGRGALYFLYIDVAHVIARADKVNIAYASQNTGSVFTSPDNSATIQYKQISTRHRINMWETFVLTPLIIGALAIALYFCVTSSSLEMRVLTTVLILMAEGLFFLPVLLELHEAKKVIK